MLQPVSITYGADPEGFFMKDGKVIGSDKILPEEGLRLSPYTSPVVVRDGVQFELNPMACTNPMGVAGSLAVSFSLLRRYLRDQQPGVTCDFSRVREVSREELDSLSQKARELGCKPSQNIYLGKTKPLNCDPKTYLKRSLGGHVHLGLMSTNVYTMAQNRDARQRLIPLLDIFVGNFCVLFDQDPGAAERRQNYGRAGEYRLVKYGVEYRTLDNFWLTNYTLMNFVFGMCNLATSVLVTTLAGRDVETELTKIVNIKRVIKAINNNDAKLARKNVEDLRGFLEANLPDTPFFPMRPRTVGKFIELTDAVRDMGVDGFFGGDPLTHWNSTARVSFSEYMEGL